MGVLLLGAVLFAGPRARSAAALEPPTDYAAHPVVHPEEVHRGPRRVISIAPSITELCAALGLADRLVGRTQYCTHPPGVRHATVIGAYADTNMEMIIALNPDIVLITDSSPKLQDQLNGLGLHYATVPDSTLNDVFVAINTVGTLLERPRTAAMLLDRLQRDLEGLRQQRRRSNSRVLFTFSPLPPEAEAIYVAGPGGYLDSLLELAGYTNAVAGYLDAPWGKISVESLLNISPDQILEIRPPDHPPVTARLYQGWSVLSTVPAIRQQRVRSLSSTAIAKPGPRINVALFEIISALEPALP